MYIVAFKKTDEAPCNCFRWVSPLLANPENELPRHFSKLGQGEGLINHVVAACEREGVLAV